jgi:hypothetical protein
MQIIKEMNLKCFVGKVNFPDNSENYGRRSWGLLKVTKWVHGAKPPEKYEI